MKTITHPRFRDVNFMVVDEVIGNKGCLVKGWWVNKCGKYLHGFERLMMKREKYNEFQEVK